MISGMFNPYLNIFKLPYRKPTQKQAFNNSSEIMRSHFLEKKLHPSKKTIICANKTSTRLRREVPTNSFKNANSNVKDHQKDLSASENIEEDLCFCKTRNLANYRAITWSIYD